jgi:hypothetical protein
MRHQSRSRTSRSAMARMTSEVACEPELLPELTIRGMNNVRINVLSNSLWKLCPLQLALEALHRTCRRIARTLGIPLKIAAKIDPVDEAYFREKIAPLLGDSGGEFIGEIDERSKAKFLGEAHALLFLIDWPEPFGLVMIEARACGTLSSRSATVRSRRSSTRA